MLITLGLGKKSANNIFNIFSNKYLFLAANDFDQGAWQLNGLY